MRVIETEYRTKDQPPCKTSAEMTELCCGEPTAELFCCDKIEIWHGYKQEEVLDALGITLDESGRDSNGNLVEVRFKPRNGPCGLLETRYKFNKDCCDGVADLVWDEFMSASVVARNSSALIYINGGKTGAETITIKVRGVGFWLNSTHTKREITLGKTSAVVPLVFRVYTDDDACGSCLVSVKDGCSEVSHYLRSTEGRWVQIDKELCPLRGLAPDEIVSTSPAAAGTNAYGLVVMQAIVGKYKIQQSIWTGYWLATSGGKSCDALPDEYKTSPEEMEAILEGILHKEHGIDEIYIDGRAGFGDTLTPFKPSFIAYPAYDHFPWGRQGEIYYAQYTGTNSSGGKYCTSAGYTVGYPNPSVYDDTYIRVWEWECYD